jgi:hypothetical protein
MRLLAEPGPDLDMAEIDDRVAALLAEPAMEIEWPTEEELAALFAAPIGAEIEGLDQ